MNSRGLRGGPPGVVEALENKLAKILELTDRAIVIFGERSRGIVLIVVVMTMTMLRRRIGMRASWQLVEDWPPQVSQPVKGQQPD